MLLLAALAWAAWNRVADAPPTRDGAPSWSPDSRQIVFYAEQPSGKADLFTMSADGSDRRTLGPSTPAADEGAPAFSPDGSHVAYDTDRDGNFEIYVMAADGTAPRRLTNHPARDLAPAWSPDGRRLAFMSDRERRTEQGAATFDVFTMNADGSDVQRVTSEATSWFPQYSRDGHRLAFHVWRDVHVFDLQSKTMTRLTSDPMNGMYPTWSPAGDKLAFMSWRSGRTEIFTMNVDGTNQQRVVAMPTGGAIDPRWSPDGSRIAFVHVPEATPESPQDPASWRRIYVMDLATGKLSRLSR